MHKLLLNKWLLHVAVAVPVFLSRMGILPPNYSPLGSFGFFSGNALLYWGMILAFDSFVGGFYPGFLFTYLGFAAYFFLGKYARTSARRQILLVPLASVLFFLFSNFGVWLYWYPRTLEGLMQCYMLALPFFKNTFLGDLGFGYGYMLLQLAHGKRVIRVHHFRTAWL